MHSSRLEPIHRIARKNEEGAVRRFVERQRLLAQQQTRLRELRGYLADYCRAPAQPQASVLLRVRREFIERLRGAVSMQEAAVEQARLACEQERARWLLAHRNTEVLDRLAAQYRVQEARVEDRRAQRETDEVAAQLWLAMERERP
jgi:flagellar protein FliJ